MCDILEFILILVDMVLSFVLNIILGVIFLVAFILAWIFWIITGCGACGPYAGGYYPVYGNGFQFRSRYMRPVGPTGSACCVV
jgi:hypothetical protein